MTTVVKAVVVVRVEVVMTMTVMPTQIQRLRPQLFSLVKRMMISELGEGCGAFRVLGPNDMSK